MKLGRIEKIVIILILAVSAVGAAVVFTAADKGDCAVISLSGKEVFRRSLSEEGEFTVPGIPGMRFEIRDGGVRVFSSDCPDKLCVKTGLVTYEEMSAVCLPNRVIVTVEVDDTES